VIPGSLLQGPDYASDYANNMASASLAKPVHGESVEMTSCLDLRPIRREDSHKAFLKDLLVVRMWNPDAHCPSAFQSGARQRPLHLSLTLWRKQSECQNVAVPPT
jgi:hypothetical protein